MDKLLIWDIDGTLISSGGVGKISLNKTFEEKYFISNAFDKINMAGKMDKNILTEALINNKIIDYDLNEIIFDYGKHLKRELKLNKKFSLLPNVKKNLQIMQNDNKIYNVIATGNSEVGGILKLKHAGLLEWFRVGSYGNNHETRESLVKNAINVAKYMYDIDFSSNNIFMIGDTPDDIIAGKNNNIKTIALATGGYSYKELQKNKPDFLFKKLPENLINKI